MVQLDVFEDEMERDAQEVKAMGGGIFHIWKGKRYTLIMIVTTLNEEDPNKIFSFLQTSAQASPHYQSFVETMQCLLDFTVDVAHGPKIWDTFKYIPHH